jgi:hypothetical protein
VADQERAVVEVYVDLDAAELALQRVEERPRVLIVVMGVAAGAGGGRQRGRQRRERVEGRPIRAGDQREDGRAEARLPSQSGGTVSKPWRRAKGTPGPTRASPSDGLAKPA